MLTLQELKDNFKIMEEVLFDEPLPSDAGKTDQWICYLEALKRDKEITSIEFTKYKFIYLQLNESPPVTSDDIIPQEIKESFLNYK